MLAFLFYLL